MSAVDFRLVARALSDEYPYQPHYSAAASHPAVRITHRQFEYRLNDTEREAPPFDRLDKLRRGARRALREEDVAHFEVLYDASGPIGYKAVTKMANNVE